MFFVLVSLSACRDPAPLGDLRFPEPGEAAPRWGSDPLTRALRPVLPGSTPSAERPEPAPSWRLESAYELLSASGTRRVERVRREWLGREARRRQWVELEAPGEAPVARFREDRWEQGRHLSRTLTARFLPHDDAARWEADLARDLGAWRSLALALGCKPASPAAPGAGGASEVTCPAAVALRWEQGQGQELSVRVEGRSASGTSARYSASLRTGGGEPWAPLEPAQIGAQERPRTHHRMMKHLAPYRGASAEKP